MPEEELDELNLVYFGMDDNNVAENIEHENTSMRSRFIQQVFVRLCQLFFGSRFHKRWVLQVNLTLFSQFQLQLDVLYNQVFGLELEDLHFQIKLLLLDFDAASA